MITDEWDVDDKKDRTFPKQDCHPLSASSMTTFANREPEPLKRKKDRPKNDIPHTVATTNPPLEQEGGFTPMFLRAARRTPSLETNEPTLEQNVMEVKLK